MYTVIKSHANIKGKVYTKGSDVELEDSLAKHLLEQNVVIATNSMRLPTAADGLFEQLKKDIAQKDDMIAKQKGIIKELTSEIEAMRNENAVLVAKRK